MHLDDAVAVARLNGAPIPQHIAPLLSQHAHRCHWSPDPEGTLAPPSSALRRGVGCGFRKTPGHPLDGGYLPRNNAISSELMWRLVGSTHCSWPHGIFLGHRSR